MKKRKSPRVRTHKTSSRKKLSKDLLELWSECVKVTNNYTCQLCGARGWRPGEEKAYRQGKIQIKKRRLNSHHVWSRGGHTSTKFDLDNGLCVCFQCHQVLHNEPETALNFYKTLFTQKQWDELKLKAHQIARFSMAELEQMRDELKEKISLTKKNEYDKSK